jgi:hypothetical protein
MLVEDTLSLTEWTSVLKLSAIWQMDRVREIAVERMTRITAGLTEWMAVLDLSIAHQLLEVRELAMRRLSTCAETGVSRILLARKYQVDAWMREGCQQLVERRECFSDEEEEELGWKTVSKLYRIRDKRFTDSQHRTYNLGGQSHLVKANIEQEFEAELMGMGIRIRRASPYLTVPDDEDVDHDRPTSPNCCSVSSNVGPPSHSWPIIY